MKQNLTATAATTIKASPETVWHALTDPEQISRYFFGTRISTSWKIGEPITWKGSWKGKDYEDKGIVKEFDPPHRLAYTHFSPLTGQEDLPQNYHNILITVQEQSGGSEVTLTQDGNGSEEELGHVQKNWEGVLESLRQLLEVGGKPGN